MDLRQFLSTLGVTQPLPPLPPSFSFSVANSDHQCGAYDPQCEDIRDVWERLRGLVVRGRGTDFGRRYPQDVALAQRLGCTAFRFSIAWSRVEPSPGRFDMAVLGHYRSIVETVRTAGIEPVVTLHHFTWPLHVERRGGMIADGFPDWFAAYAEAVAGHLGPDVRYWLTFNEPGNVVVGYIKPWWVGEYLAPPGLPEGVGLEEQFDAVARLIRNLFLAHTRARHVIRSLNPHAQVGANPALLGLPVWSQRWINCNAMRTKDGAGLRKQGQRFTTRAFRERGDVDLVMAMLTHHMNERVRCFSPKSTSLLLKGYWSEQAAP